MAERAGLVAGHAARWQLPAAVTASFVLTATLAADVAARRQAVSLVPARIATELAVIGVGWTIAALVSGLARRAPRAPTTSTSLLGAATALSALGAAARIRGGPAAPGDRVAVAATVGALITVLVVVGRLCRGNSATDVVLRSAWCLTWTAVGWLVLGNAIGASPASNVRELTAHGAAAIALASSAVVLWSCVRLREHRARALARFAIIAIATLATWSSGPAEVIWLAAAVAIILIPRLPGWIGALRRNPRFQRTRRQPIRVARAVAGRSKTAHATGSRAARAGARATSTGLRAVGNAARAALLSVARPLGPDGPARPNRTTHRDRPWAIAFVLIVTLTIAVDLISALRLGAQPIGDGAKLVVRSADVGTSHTPLLGMPTSFAERSGAVDAHHPGPMLFDLLAPFIRLLGYRVGAFVGAAVLSWGCWLLAVWAAFRAGGRLAALGALVGGALIGNVIIRNLAFEPVNIYPAFQAMFAVPLLCWAAVTGTRRALLWAVVLASLATQIYLAHTLLVAVPVIWAAVVLWTERRTSPGNRRTLLAATAVGLVCWALPLWEALTNSGGNLRSLTRATFADGSTLGASGLLRAPAWALQVPLRWHRLDRAFGPSSATYLGGLPTAGLLVSALALLLVGVGWRRAPTAHRRLWVLTGIVVLAAGVTASQLRNAPTPAYTVLWLGEVSVFTWYAVALTVVWSTQRALARGQIQVPGVLDPLLSGLVATLVLLGGLRASTLDEIRGPYSFVDLAQPALLRGARDGTDADDSVLIVPLDGAAPQIAGESLSAPMILEGRTIRVTPFNREYYSHDRSVGTAWTGTALLVTTGVAPVEPRGERLARVEPPGWSQRAYDAGVRRVARWARDHGPIEVDTSNRRGLAVTLSRWFDGSECGELDHQVDGTADAANLPDGAIARLYVERLVVAPRLPAALEREVDERLLATPLEVWRAPVDEPLGTLEPEAAFGPCSPPG